MFPKLNNKKLFYDDFDFGYSKLKKIYLHMFLIYLMQIQLLNASVTLVNFDLTINFSIKLNAKIFEIRFY